MKSLQEQLEDIQRRKRVRGVVVPFGNSARMHRLNEEEKRILILMAEEQG
jgi:hypothetical protein